jgi:pyruvyltransferase
MRLSGRFEKLRRFARWRFADAGVPIWWHVGRPNFGDDINPTFFQSLAGVAVRFAADRNGPHLLGAGSILEKASPLSIVCGSGFLEIPWGMRPRPAEVVAVRGARSLVALRGSPSTLLGDPLVLVDALVDDVPKRHAIGLVPHVRSVARWRSANRDRHLLIDPGLDPWAVVEAIASCETVLSQSLHGLIVADALGVPNVWIAPSDAMAGGRFKFDDYFSTLDADKDCVPETREIFDRPHLFESSVGRYRFCKDSYRRAIAAACERILEPRALAA